MTGLPAALWVELLKARRSKVPWLTAAAFSLAPMVGGLFMFALLHPDRARAMGLITMKAQLTAGTADWPTFLSLLAQSAAVGGALAFSLVTAWVFGREATDRTMPALLAVPTSREAIVVAKFAVVILWTAAVVAWMLVLGVVIGRLLALPGMTDGLLRAGAWQLAGSAALALSLVTPVALVASAGRGYLPPLGLALFTLALAQVAALTGWGAWFPWSVPALHSGLAGPRSSILGTHSYILVAVVCFGGLAMTLRWWRTADHAP